MIKIRYSLLILFVCLLMACENSFESSVPFYAPTDFGIAKVDWGCLELSWTDNTNKEMQYQIDRRVGEGEWEIEFQILPANTVRYIDSEVNVCADYTYRVFAYNYEECSGCAESVYSYYFDEVDSIISNPNNVTILRPGLGEFFSFNLFGLNGEIPDLDYEICIEIISAPVGSYIYNNGTQCNSLSVTTSNGNGSIYLHAGDEEGEILLKAHTFKTTGEEVSAEFQILVDYPEVTDIILISEDYNFLYPNDSIEVSVELRSSPSYWNVVEEEYEIFYQFIEKPWDTNINGSMYDINELYPLTTIDGRSTVTLNSGEYSGNIELKIFTYNSLGEEIALTKNYCVVSYNDAEYCSIDAGGISEGVDVGDGFWQINLDAYLRGGGYWPLMDGSLVQFTLLNNYPEVFLEDELSYVGNTEDSEPGVAYNFITYHGSQTNETVLVRIECGELSEDYEVVLPIQYPILYLGYAPPDMDWNWENGIHTSTIDFTVYDGQHNGIDNQILLFSMDLGEPVDMGSDDDDDPISELTGAYYNGSYYSHGYIDKDWIFQISECPPPQGNIPGTITGDLNVTSPGTEIDSTYPLTLYRYP